MGLIQVAELRLAILDAAVGASYVAGLSPATLGLVAGMQKEAFH